MGRYTGKRGNRLPPFVALPWDLLNSKAYKDLPPSAGKALPYFLGRVKLPFNAPERYTFDFSFSYTEADKYGFANGTHHRNISELIEKGFIDSVYKGGKRSFGMSSSLFRLSERWKKYGSADFKKIIWRDILPELKKQRSTPKMETCSFKNGADNEENDGVHFQN